MSFGSFGDSSSGAGPASPAPMAEINTTPLVDVMLVLLVIFIVTAPLLTHGIRIDLPKAAATAAPEEPRTVVLAIDAEGRAYWNDEPVADPDLPRLMAEAAGTEPQPELHLRADQGTRYQRLAEIMAMARNAGLSRLGFVTEPRASAR